MAEGFWYILAICLLLGAGALGAWALFWDRSRGRLRCPKCQYRMEGIAASTVERRGKSLTGHVCPECGFVAARESELRRTRRRWGAVAVAGLMLLGSHVASSMPAVQERSYRALIPTWVLVTVWPIEDLAGSPRGTRWAHSGQRELHGRLEEHWPEWMERRWVRRMLRHERRDLFPEARFAAHQQRVYCLRPLWQSLRFDAPWYMSVEDWIEHEQPPLTQSPDIDPDKSVNYNTLRGWEDVYTSRMHDLVESFVDAEIWYRNGGDSGMMVNGVSHLAVLAQPQTLERIERFLAELERVAKDGPGAHATCAYLDPPAVVYNIADMRGEDDYTGEDFADQVVEKSCRGLRYQVLRGAIVIVVQEDQACVDLFEAELARARAIAVPNRE